MAHVAIKTKATAEKLMRVLARDELSSLAEAMTLPHTASPKEIADSMSTLPRYEIVRIILGAANPTLLLLRDIFDALEIFGVSARTTGCAFALADPVSGRAKSELEFSPQAVGTVCHWEAEKDLKPLATSLESLRSSWQRFGPVWAKLLQDATPVRSRGRINVVRSAIHQREVREPDSEYVDDDAQRVLELFTSKLATLADRLTQIPDPAIPAELSRILRDIRQLLTEASRVLHERRSSYRRSSVKQRELGEQVIRRYVTTQFTQDFNKFLEDIYVLSSLTEGEQLFDMLRLDVWSSRPQLYEVWALLTILRWLARRGYGVKLLRASLAPTSVFRWDLAYAKDSSPCAVVNVPGGEDLYLFYQLYRPSGDMPDLCLLKDSNANSEPVWSVDLKHSEKGGYSIRSYRLTAERYRDSFGAPVSIVAEYFLRREYEGENPKLFGPGAVLVHDCRPSRPGLDVLFQELSDCHPNVSSTLVCIDLSESFSSNLAAALSRFREEANADESGETYLNEFVCFAGSVKTQLGFSSWLSGAQEHIQKPELVPGTSWAPLLQTISGVIKSSHITKILLITDGGFDVPLDSAIKRLEEDFNVSVRVFS